MHERTKVRVDRVQQLIDAAIQCLALEGIPIRRPRTTQQIFHSTLGVVNSTYPIDQVIDALNAQITQWSSAPIVMRHFALERPLRRFSAQSFGHHY